MMQFIDTRHVWEAYATHPNVMLVTADQWPGYGLALGPGANRHCSYHPRASLIDRRCNLMIAERALQKVYAQHASTGRT